MTALAGWHEFMRSKDPAALETLLTPDAVFQSPVVHTPQRGRALVMHYLLAATEVLGGPSFNYQGEYKNDRGAVLEFTTVIDGIEINGIDIITFDEAGKIKHFKVMLRPLKAINLVHALMGERLAG